MALPSKRVLRGLRMLDANPIVTYNDVRPDEVEMRVTRRSGFPTGRSRRRTLAETGRRSQGRQRGVAGDPARLPTQPRNTITSASYSPLGYCLCDSIVGIRAKVLVRYNLHNRPIAVCAF